MFQELFSGKPVQDGGFWNLPHVLRMHLQKGYFSFQIFRFSDIFRCLFYNIITFYKNTNGRSDNIISVFSGILTGEDIFILRCSFLKSKKLFRKVILRNFNFSGKYLCSCKNKTENGFYLKVNVGIFRRNENRLPKTGAPQAFATLIFQM